MTSRPPDAAPATTHTPRSGTRRWRSPVAVWAGCGFVALLAQAVIFARWLAAGDIHSAPKDFAIPAHRAALVWAEQAAGILIVVCCVIVALRQSRREHNVSWNAALVIGGTFTFWLGFLSCWDRQYAAANRYALNITSWAPYVPGWHGPDPGQQIETLVAAQILMYTALVVWPWGQQLLLRPVLRRKPHWGMIRLLPVLLITGFVTDLVIEGTLITLLGAYSWPTANWSLSLFGGHWYQLPLVNIAIGAVTMASMPTFMLLRAQRSGRPVHIFQGGERFTRRADAWLRALAGVGFMNVVMALYWVLIPLLATASGPGPLPPDTPGWLWHT
ncbi:spirocyclase AveC family protein [Streptomyces sp. BE303]|uniref:spirocyclase AveC family protein n=1 Tax=Streptomyces sp. BE303 TaxID=3002528 RepID=UPI002E75B74F|nr:spirocyclase AveC family protein [Streptomyces sp. BE303]MED7950946.1 spirocyclase AveC family protein [Streptomyces sp. BE303]